VLQREDPSARRKANHLARRLAGGEAVADGGLLERAPASLGQDPAGPCRLPVEPLGDHRARLPGERLAALAQVWRHRRPPAIEDVAGSRGLEEDRDPGGWPSSPPELVRLGRLDQGPPGRRLALVDRAGGDGIWKLVEDVP